MSQARKRSAVNEMVNEAHERKMLKEEQKRLDKLEKRSSKRVRTVAHDTEIINRFFSPMGVYDAIG